MKLYNIFKKLRDKKGSEKIEDSTPTEATKFKKRKEIKPDEVRKCGYCRKQIIGKRYCDDKCKETHLAYQRKYQAKYVKRPEVRKRLNEYYREYYKNRDDIKQKRLAYMRKYNNSQKHKIFYDDYIKREGVKDKVKEYYKEYYKKNKDKYNTPEAKEKRRINAKKYYRKKKFEKIIEGDKNENN